MQQVRVSDTAGKSECAQRNLKYHFTRAVGQVMDSIILPLARLLALPQRQPAEPLSPCMTPPPPGCSP